MNLCTVSASRFWSSVNSKSILDALLADFPDGKLERSCSGSPRTRLEAEDHVSDDVALNLVGAPVDRRLAEVEVPAGERCRIRRSQESLRRSRLAAHVSERVRPRRVEHQLRDRLLDLR